MLKKGFSTILIVVIVLVVIAGGTLAWQYWPEAEEKNCTKEGEIECNVMGCTPCCGELEDRDVLTPVNISGEVVCVEEMTQQRCVNCGDGVCGIGEDWCICSEDCEKPDIVELPEVTVDYSEADNFEIADCRTGYLDKIGETDDILLYHINKENQYKVFWCNLQTNQEMELELLGHSESVNVKLSLSPNGDYITKTTWASAVALPKIELMSFDNTNELIVLAEGKKDSFMEIIWSDDSSRIAYWTADRNARPPSFSVYYLADITGAEPRLVKIYNDMTAQGFVNLKQLISSENKLYLERTRIMNGAPAVWEQDIIEL